MIRIITSASLTVFMIVCSGCGCDESRMKFPPVEVAGSEGEGCEAGSEGCPCDQGECGSGFVCEADLCVAAPTDDDDAAGGRATGGAPTHHGNDGGSAGASPEASSGGAGGAAPDGGAAGAVGAGGATGGSSVAGAGGQDLCDPTFSTSDACGGEERGTWKLVGACTAVGFLETFLSRCRGATGEDRTTGTGTVVLDGTHYSRTVTVHQSYEVLLPAGNFCRGDQSSDCSELASMVALLGYDLSGTCVSDGAGGCECAFAGETVSTSSGTYTVDRAAGELDAHGDDGDYLYDYCVEGERMTGRRRTGSDIETGIVQLLLRQGDAGG
jgi:hypothetical protein